MAVEDLRPSADATKPTRCSASFVNMAVLTPIVKTMGRRFYRLVEADGVAGLVAGGGAYRPNTP